jgi:hypothetical protein
MSFSPDYTTARACFRQMVPAAGGRLDVLTLTAKGPNEEALSIDIGWFGAEAPQKVLLHSSGLHGVEGFAGSAIQLQVMRTLPSMSVDSALILVHILNPYGMAWLRRVNETNVDLNRNFLANGEYSGAPEAYTRLNQFLNPASAPSTDFYLIKAAGWILRYGFPTLKQAVAGGQYEFPEGLFFGGKRLEEGPLKYQTFIAQRLSSVRYISAIDVHTGLGRYGEDTILTGTNEYAELRRVYGNRVAPSGPTESPAYQVRGGLHARLPAIVPQARVSFLTQEFGTYNPIKVLGALRTENRWHYHGGRLPGHAAGRTLKNTFCPDDESWRQAVLKRGQELLSEVWVQLGNAPVP